MLAARDPGPAPAGLATAVRARLDADRGPRRLWSIGRLAAATAGVTGLATVLVLALVVARPLPTGPGSSPLPSATGPYTIQPGDGVVTGEYYPIAQTIAALLAFASLFVVARTSADRRAIIGASLGMALIGLAAASIGTSDAIAFVGGGSGVTPSGDGPPDSPGMYVSVTGDRPFVLILTVTNTSRLPLTIEGLPEQGLLLANGQTQPRLVGLGRLPRCCDAGSIERFRPVTLEPGGAVDLAIGGMAGSCAIPPGGPTDGQFSSFETIPIVYEQLTIRHTAEVTLPEPVVVRASGAVCP
jgi:hypothetical protein